MAFDRKILKAVAFDRHLFNNTNSTCAQVGGGQGVPLLIEQKFMTPLGVLTPPGHVNKMQHLVLVHRGVRGPHPLKKKFMTPPGHFQMQHLVLVHRGVRGSPSSWNKSL